MALMTYYSFDAVLKQIYTPKDANGISKWAQQAQFWQWVEDGQKETPPAGPEVNECGVVSP